MQKAQISFLCNYPVLKSYQKLIPSSFFDAAKAVYHILKNQYNRERSINNELIFKEEKSGQEDRNTIVLDHFKSSCWLVLAVMTEW